MKSNNKKFVVTYSIGTFGRLKVYSYLSERSWYNYQHRSVNDKIFEYVYHKAHFSPKSVAAKWKSADKRLSRKYTLYNQ